MVMDCDLRPPQILSYLNTLGYQNITAEQLKEFLVDLKKLMKYETKQKHIVPVSKQTQQLKENYISVHIKKPRNVRSAHPAKDVSEWGVPPPPEHKQPLKEIVNMKESTSTMQEALCVPSVSSRPSLKSLDNNAADLKLKRFEKKKPKAGYPLKPIKSDPVALYHYYQELWKRQKVPGENNHCQLRWAIRKQLIGEQHSLSTYPSIDTVARDKHRG